MVSRTLVIIYPPPPWWHVLHEAVRPGGGNVNAAAWVAVALASAAVAMTPIICGTIIWLNR